MKDAKKYSGGCHCGQVRYEATMELTGGMECNCSICAKKGAILTFVPAEDFALKSGQDSLTDYQFGKKNIHHLFCRVCGIPSFARGTGPNGKKMCAVNVRCLDDVNVSVLPLKHVDGKSL